MNTRLNTGITPLACVTALAVLVLVITSTRQAEISTMVDTEAVKPMVPEQQPAGWLATGQKNIALYKQLTATYKTRIAEKYPSGPENNEAIVATVQHIIQHLDSMRYFYETSPLKPAIRNVLLQHNQTKRVQWSALFEQWSNGQKPDPAHKSDRALTRPNTSTAAAKLDLPSADRLPAQPTLAADSTQASDPVTPGHVAKKTINTPSDQYDLLELSLGLVHE